MRAIAWCLWLLVLPGEAQGQHRPPADTVELRWRGRIEAARVREAAHDDDQALKEYEAAQAIRPSAFGLLQIARCMERLGYDAAAAVRYQAFLADPAADPIDAARARLRLAALRPGGDPQPRVAAGAESPSVPRGPGSEAKVAIGATRPAPASPRAMHPATRSTRRPPIGAPVAPGVRGPVGALALVAGFLTAGAAVGGLALLADARRQYQVLQHQCKDYCRPEEWSPVAVQEKVAIGLIGLGGLLAVTDIALWSVWGARRRNEVHVWVAPSVGGLVVGGAFQ